MRYTIIDNVLFPVTRITVQHEVPVTPEDIENNPELEGQETRIVEEVIHNPTDEMIDAEKAGYIFIPELATDPPAYDPTTSKLRRKYVVLDDAYITMVWEAIPFTKQELINNRLKLIEKANEDYALKLVTPVEYTNGHTYKPEWVSMYYVPAIQYMTFPYPVESADTIIPTSMTKEELTALSTFLSSKVKDFLQEFHQTVDSLYMEIAQLQQEEVSNE